MLRIEKFYKEEWECKNQHSRAQCMLTRNLFEVLNKVKGYGHTYPLTGSSLYSLLVLISAGGFSWVAATCESHVCKRI